MGRLAKKSCQTSAHWNAARPPLPRVQSVIVGNLVLQRDNPMGASCCGSAAESMKCWSVKRPSKGSVSIIT